MLLIIVLSHSSVRNTHELIMLPGAVSAGVGEGHKGKPHQSFNPVVRVTEDYLTQSGIIRATLRDRNHDTTMYSLTLPICPLVGCITINNRRLITLTEIFSSYIILIACTHKHTQALVY